MKPPGLSGLVVTMICMMLLVVTAACAAGTSGPGAQGAYTIVDTGQSECYDNTRVITSPGQGNAFYGQDAQYSGYPPSYQTGSDGKTVFDRNTGLTWQGSPDTNGDGQLSTDDKLTWTNAQAYPAKLNAANFGGYSDWRLPTIKELYSLINFDGTDPVVSDTSATGLTPFIDTDFFKFEYGEPGAGERIIDSQYASGTLDVSTGWNGDKLFGVNFADGRIKGYGLSMHGSEKTFFVQCVRGNTEYGKNNFVVNGNGTITDLSTGLMWSRADSATGMNWEEAFAWVHEKNSGNYLGYSDWRLPNAKELQSIVDYTRSPDTTGTAAIDPVFSCTGITNEAGQADYPFYWTGTTHVSSDGSGEAGVYIAFGRAMGYMNGQWQDVHGAGAQRSDPKVGKTADYPHGRGPQGDAIRIDNFVRPVRDAGGAVTTAATTTPAVKVTKFLFIKPTNSYSEIISRFITTKVLLALPTISGPLAPVKNTTPGLLQQKESTVPGRFLSARTYHAFIPY